MSIQSGATADRKLRVAAYTVIMLGIGGWCLYDGLVAYPRSNLAEMQRSIPQDVQFTVVPDPRVTKALDSAKSSDLQASLGEPPLKLREESRYFGRDGYLALPADGGPARWFAVKYTTTDMVTQQGLAALLFVGGIYFLFKLVGVLGMQVVLDDGGLHPKPGQTIAWDAMERLDTARFREKGWVDLHHQSGGRAAVQRIDSYQVREFDAIVDQICERKGFANPLAAERQAGSAGGPKA